MNTDKIEKLALILGHDRKGPFTGVYYDGKWVKDVGHPERGSSLLADIVAVVQARLDGPVMSASDLKPGERFKFAQGHERPDKHGQVMMVLGTPMPPQLLQWTPTRGCERGILYTFIESDRVHVVND